jgi:hypothetical protein
MTRYESYLKQYRDLKNVIATASMGFDHRFGHQTEK